MIFSLFNKQIKSPIHGPITFIKIKGNKALRAGGVTHSGGEILPMWEEVLNNIANNGSQITNCLLLGVGGGDVLKILKRQYPRAYVVGVEIDPVMVEIAQKEFGLSVDNNTEIIIEDAIKWTKENQTKKKFDIIVCDLYIGPLNPIESRTKQYILNLKQMLSPDGVLVYNAHFQEKNKQEFEILMKNMRSLFSHVDIAFSYPLNRVLIVRR